MIKINREVIGDLFRSYPFIIAAYQFGSTIRGQESPLSDLDIAILVDEEKAPGRYELLKTELFLAHELQKRLGVSEVDLLTLNHQKPHLQYAVLRTGELIYDIGSSYRIRFAQRVVQAYLDFQPTLRFIDRFQTEGLLRSCGLR